MSASTTTIENEMRGKDFESMIRKNIQIHTDIRQMILLFGKYITKEISLDIFSSNFAKYAIIFC